MNDYWLIIAFIDYEGARVLLDGWYPMEIGSFKECKEAAQSAMDYIKQYMEQPEGIAGVKTYCLTIEDLMGESI